MFTTAKDLQRNLSEHAHADGRAARGWLEAYWNARGTSLAELPASELRNIADVYKQHGMESYQKGILEARLGPLNQEKIAAAEGAPITQLLKQRAAELAPDVVPQIDSKKLEPEEISTLVTLLRARAQAGDEIRVVIKHSIFGDERIEQAQGKVDVVFDRGAWTVAFVAQQEPAFPFGFYVKDIVALGEPVPGRKTVPYDFGKSREHVDAFVRSLEGNPEISAEVRAYLQSASSWAPGPWSWTVPATHVNGDRVVLSHRHGEAYYYPATLRGGTYVPPPSQSPPEAADSADSKISLKADEGRNGEEFTVVERRSSSSFFQEFTRRAAQLYKAASDLFRAYAT